MIGTVTITRTDWNGRVLARSLMIPNGEARCEFIEKCDAAADAMRQQFPLGYTFRNGIEVLPRDIHLRHISSELVGLKRGRPKGVVENKPRQKQRWTSDAVAEFSRLWRIHAPMKEMAEKYNVTISQISTCARRFGLVSRRSKGRS